MDQVEKQLQVMHQSKTMQQTIQDLYRWEKEMKQKENVSQQAATNESFDSEFPIRSHVPPSSSAQPLNSNEPTTSSSIVEIPSTLDKANEFKTRGNDCVKNGQFQKAIHYYTEAIRLNKFDAIYFSNRAHCYLKLNRFLECVEDCTIAIGLDENCVKAYYRRMQAHENIKGNTVAAFSDCQTVLRFEPKNTEARMSLERLRKAMKVEHSVPPPSLPSANNKFPNQNQNQNRWTRGPKNNNYVAPANKPTYTHQQRWNSKFDGRNDYKRTDFVSKPPHMRSKQTFNRIKIVDKFTQTECSGGGGVGSGDGPSKNEQRVAAVPNNSIGDNTTTTDQKTTTTTTTEKTSPSCPAPKTTAQFHMQWMTATSQQQKYSILKSIYDSDVAQLLGSQFEVPILADILAVLMQMFVADRQPIVNIMHGIVNNRQMSIVALLMTAEHKLTFTKLITYMRTTGETDPKRIDVIEKIFESYILPLN